MPTGIEETVVAAAAAGAEAESAGVEAAIVANEGTIAATAETAAREGTELLKDALQKLDSNVIDRLYKKILRASNEQIKRSRELIKNDSKLFRRQREFIDRYSDSSGHTDEAYERFRSGEEQFKARFGEEYDTKEAKELGAEVVRAGKAKTTIGDLHVRYPYPVKTECLTVKDGRIIKEPFTFQPNVWYAREVKNGQKKYLVDQIKDGHLMRQLKEQKELGYEPLAITTKDIFTDAEHSPEEIANIIKTVEGTGGRVIPSLPTHAEQFLYLMGGLQ